MGVVAASDCLADVAAHTSQLDPGHAPEGGFVMEAIFVCAVGAINPRKGSISEL